MDVKSAQLIVLANLLRVGAGTKYGHAIGIRSGMSYDDFRTSIPLGTYKDIAPWVERCKTGESNIMCPGVVRRFAVSAGTTGQGKHIPISDDRLSDDLGFMKRVTRQVIRDNPDPGLFLGRHIALSGSVETIDGCDYGEISGMLACASPRWIRLWQSLCPEKAARMTWPDRFEAIIHNSLFSDVRVITGVPSWLLILIREVSKRRDLPIGEIWPNLRLIITGGVALAGYHDVLRNELSGLPVRYLENYGASEAYHSFDWYDNGSMLLQYDMNNFYELAPLARDSSGKISTQPSENLIPVWDAEPGIEYGLVVSNRSGLWRYLTNDIVQFTQSIAPRLQVIGRLTDMTDAFGEALSASDVLDASSSIRSLFSITQVHIQSRWIGEPPVPGHVWLLVVPESIKRAELISAEQALVDELDSSLKAINRHYAIRRDTGALGSPKIQVIGIDEYESLLRKLPKSQSKLGMFIP